MRVPNQSAIHKGLPKSTFNSPDLGNVDSITATTHSAAPGPLHQELKALAGVHVPEGEKGIQALESSGIKLRIVTLVERLLEDLNSRDLAKEDAKTLLTGIGILTDKLLLLENRSLNAQGPSSSSLTDAERTEKLQRVAILLAKAGAELPPGTTVTAVVESSE